MHRWFACLLVLPFVGCADPGPPAPPLAHELVWTQRDFEEEGGLFSIVGTLNLKVSPEGEGESVCKRQLLTDVERSGSLPTAMRWELHTKVEAWVASAGKPETVSAKSHGTLTYGDLKVGWEKGASLSPELSSLVEYLKQVTFALKIVRKRG